MNYCVDQIHRQLLDRGCGTLPQIEVFETIGSTNTYLLGLDGVANRVCLAKRQTAGRGRRGRTWQSRASGSVLMSMGWEFNGQDLSGLSLVCGLASVWALREFGLAGVALKWPNDLLVNEKKLAGIQFHAGARTLHVRPRKVQTVFKWCIHVQTQSHNTFSTT